MSVFLLLNSTALFLTPFPVSGTQHKESDRRSKENISKAPEMRGMSPVEPSAAGIFAASPGSRGRAVLLCGVVFPHGIPARSPWGGQAQRAPSATSHRRSQAVPGAPGTQRGNKWHLTVAKVTSGGVWRPSPWDCRCLSR